MQNYFKDVMSPVPPRWALVSSAAKSSVPLVFRDRTRLCRFKLRPSNLLGSGTAAGKRGTEQESHHVAVGAAALSFTLWPEAGYPL